LKFTSQSNSRGDPFRSAQRCVAARLGAISEPGASRIGWALGNWVCHCLACQRRTGAVIGNLARFHREQITFNGTATAWQRTAESGNSLTCYFYPICGSTIYF